MKKWQIAVSILLVFALGTAAGAYGSRIIFKKRVNRVLHTEGTPGIKVIQGMVSRLDLSESQRASIQAIVDESEKEWETIRQEYEPKIKELYESVIEATKEELTEEQRNEVEQMSDKVQRRLPPRTTPGSSSPPRASNPPDASAPPGASPYGGTPPEASEPPEASAPPEMAQPFGYKSRSDRVSEIIRELQIDKGDEDVVRTAIESDIQNQEAMRSEFEKNQAAAEEKYQLETEEAQLRTEKELSKLLTPEQMEAYRQLRNPEEPKPEDFGFDGHGEGMEYKDFKQEVPDSPEGQPGGKSQQGTWSL